MTEWLYEDGIGERRAALIENGCIARALIERDSDGARAQSIHAARLLSHRDRLARLETGEEVILTRTPDISDGSACLIAITRSAIPERDLIKRAVGRISDADAPAHAPTLAQHIAATGLPVRMLAAHQSDALEAAGWSDVLDQAATGLIPFAGGILRLSLTPAMMVFDVDGTLPPAELALAGARAVAAAIIRLDIAGNIVADLPSLSGRDMRKAVDAALDTVFAAYDEPIERTAMNGFGLIQCARKRTGPSIPERLHFAPVESSALALLRRAERAQGSGTLALIAHPAVTHWLDTHPDHLATLARRCGRSISLHPDVSLGIDAGHAQ